MMNKKRLLSVPALLAAGMLIMIGCSKSGPTAPLNEWQPTDKHHALPEVGSISGTVYLDDSCEPRSIGISLRDPTPVPSLSCCPYEGASVALYYNGDLVAQTQSDAEGRYEFAKLLEGFYDVRVTYPRYEYVVATDDVVVMENQENDGVDAYYRPYYLPDEIIVYFTSLIDPVNAELILNECGCTISPSSPATPSYTYQVSVPDDLTLSEAMTCFRGKPEVRYVYNAPLCTSSFISVLPSPGWGILLDGESGLDSGYECGYASDVNM